MSLSRTVLSMTVVVALLSGITAAHQAKPAATQTAKTATQFYMDFRAAFDKAKKIEDLLPWMSAAQRKTVEGTPVADRKQMFEFLKLVATLTNVKVTKEEPLPDGSVKLTAQGFDSDKKPTNGTIQIVKENGAWKVGLESWQ